MRALQDLLDQGAPLEAIFTLALALSLADDGRKSAALKPPRWMPPHWDDDMLRFYADADLAAWWASEDAAWQTAFSAAAAHVRERAFKPFLQPYLGEIEERLIFIPNILYPTDQSWGCASAAIWSASRRRASRGATARRGPSTKTRPTSTASPSSSTATC